jgi:hypothetical protein
VARARQLRGGRRLGDADVWRLAALVRRVGVVAGVGMLLARLVWTIEPAWIALYGVFWVWLLTLAVRLVMGRDVPTVGAAGVPA